MRYLFFTLLVLIGYSHLAAQQIQKNDGTRITTTEIDQIVKKLMDTADVTGLQLGIINNNAPVYVKSYGYKNAAAKQLNDTSTCFYGASLAKSLFAYIVMQLVDEGQLYLDKPLYLYLPLPLPEYKGYEDLASDERWKLITARQCLSHTTGLPNWRQFNPNGSGKLGFMFTPGARYAYSGEGLYLLQMVIEKITGKGLEALAVEKIFQPFNMKRTSFVWQPAFESDFAVGHDMNGDTLRKSKRSKPNAAGSMETTIADYTRFVAAVLSKQRVSEKAWKEMLTPQVRIYSKRQFPTFDSVIVHDNDGIQLAYGLGWGLFNTKYGPAFFKEGHDDGWVHYTISFPEKGTSLLVMCNSSSGESIFKELVEKLTGVTIPWEWESYYPYRANIQLSANELREFTGNYTGRLNVEIKFDNGRLHVESKDAKLPKTNLYASTGNRFFLKTMDADIEFVRDGKGSVTKAIVNDEGEKYELTRAPGTGSTAAINIPNDLLLQYVGSYQFKDHIFIVTKKDSQLFLESTNPKDRLPRLQLFASSANEFYLKEVSIQCSFLKNDDGKINRISIVIGSQAPAELMKIK